jgi:hypothetical protein
VPVEEYECLSYGLEHLETVLESLDTPRRLIQVPTKQGFLFHFGVLLQQKCSVEVVFSLLSNSFSKLDFSHLRAKGIDMPLTPMH